MSCVHRVSENLSWMKPFRIKAVAENGHLIGIASYRDKMGHPPLKVNGTQGVDGRFWPRVIAEVANDASGEWKRLERPASRGKPAVFTLKSHEANVTLYVNLDIFRPMVGKMRYGRVVLANGEPAVFELKDLLPSAVSKSNDAGDWSRETIFGYLEDPLAHPPFAIAEISSKGGHLRGMGGYSDLKGTPSTAIEGTETPDGDFWPYATLQVANDPDGVWKTVALSTNPGKPLVLTIPSEQSAKILNVDLDTLRPLAGKFGYGRIVLRNGKSAAFELIDLLPPEQEAESKHDSAKR